MMNMMNNMNGMGNGQIKQLIFDPTRTTKKDKGYLAKQTMYQASSGPYQMCYRYKHSIFSFVRNFEVSKPLGICEVTVEYDHCLDVAEKYADKGVDYSVSNGLNPVVVNVVGRDFIGSNLEISEEMRDELINIRTTFNNTMDKSSQAQFPLKNEECSYLKFVTVIRPKYPTHNSFLPLNQTYRVGMITTCPIKVDKFLSGKTFVDGKMYEENFVDTLTIIECIFQLAIWKQHPILILPPFGHEEKEDNNPIDDIIKAYNYCIFKYGHMFKKIIIAIPKYYPKEIYSKYFKNIVKPNEIVADIDKQYEKEEVKKQVIKQQAINNKNSQKNLQIMNYEDDEENNNEEINEEINEQYQGQQFTKEQTKMFMKMMPMMMKMMSQQG
jgi:hypothetical protein